VLHRVLYRGDENLHHQSESRSEDEHEKTQGEFGGGDAKVPTDRGRSSSPQCQDRERTVTPTLGDELTGDDRGDQKSGHHR